MPRDTIDVFSLSYITGRLVEQKTVDPKLGQIGAYLNQLAIAQTADIIVDGLTWISKILWLGSWGGSKLMVATWPTWGQNGLLFAGLGTALLSPLDRG